MNSGRVSPGEAVGFIATLPFEAGDGFRSGILVVGGTACHAAVEESLLLHLQFGTSSRLYREWRCVLSLARPGRPSGRPGHPMSSGPAVSKALPACRRAAPQMAAIPAPRA